MDRVMIVGAVLAGLLFVRWLFRCRHAWTLVSDRDFPSGVEELAKTGKVLVTLSPAQHHLLKKTYIAVVKCDKCGALRTFREQS